MSSTPFVMEKTSTALVRPGSTEELLRKTTEMNGILAKCLSLGAAMEWALQSYELRVEREPSEDRQYFWLNLKLRVQFAPTAEAIPTSPTTGEPPCLPLVLRGW